MKICVISNLYPPHTRGGAEKVVERTVQGLKKAGHAVVVITTKPKRKLKVSDEEGIKVYRFKPINLFYYLNDYKHNSFVRLIWHGIDMFNDHAALIVNRILKKEAPDLVITHNLKGISFSLPLVIKFRKIKHIHVLHDVQLAVPSGLLMKNEENSFIANGFLTKVYRWLCKKLFGSPNVVISPSQWLLDYYQNYGFFPESKKVVLHNPILPVLKKEPPKEEKRNRYLFAGQLEKHKGLDWLVDLWEEFEIKEDLLIAGKGSLKFLVNKQLESIQLLGYLSEEKFDQVFNQVDFLIFPSLCYENAPTVINLAYQHATPIIAVNLGGVAEMVADGYTGFLFEAGNSESFKQAFEKAQQLSADELKSMSASCLDYHFTEIDEYVEELLKL